MRACLRAIVVLALLAAPASALAQPAPAASPCTVAADAAWTAQEKFVWGRTCIGEIADLNTEPGHELPKNHVLTTAFIEKILTDDKYSGAIKRHGIRVTGARFTETLDLQNIEVESELWFEQCSFEKGADLSWLRSSQPIAFNHSTVEGSLNFYAAQIESDLHMTDSALAAVNLAGAHVGRTLDLSNSRVKDALDMPDLQVGADLEMRKAKFSGAIDLRYSQIGGELDWRGASFAQDVDLTRARVDGAFRLGSTPRPGATQPDPDEPGPAIWARHVTMTARFAKLAVIPRLSDAWPNRLHIAGLTYDGIESVEGVAVGAGYEEWLHRQRRYSRQPYEQLANVLQAQGEIDTATAVRYAERDRDRDEQRRRGSWLIFAWLTLLRYLIGYGYYLFYSIGWVAGLIGLGVFVLWRSGEGRRNGMPYGVSYSFDMLLPIIQLRQKHYDIDLMGWARYYFYVHKILGWALASFLVAGLAGLTK
jgi:hypothetical protein